MENLYCYTTKNLGAVLISALLFLLVLTLLALSILQTGLLETKMSVNYQDRFFALQKAEINLIKKEQQPDASEKIATSCGVTFYRINATGEYQTTKITLQSTFAVLGDTSKCHPKPDIQPGRQSRREVDE